MIRAVIWSICSVALVPLHRMARSGLVVPFLKMTSPEIFSDGGIQPLVLAESMHFLLLTAEIMCERRLAGDN